MISELREILEQVAKRYRNLRLWWSLAACWLVLAAFAGAYVVWLSLEGRGAVSDMVVLSWFAIVLAAGALCAMVALRSPSDPRRIARRIEAKYPDLKTGLLAAVEQVVDPSWRAGGVSPLSSEGGLWSAVSAGSGDPRRATRQLAKPMGYLESSVVREVVAHSRTHDWGEAVPSWMLGLAKGAHASALILLMAATIALVSRSVSNKHGGSDPYGSPGSAAMSVQVDPGNAEIEKGSPLLVVARFDGAVPPEASLVLGDGKTGSDPVRSMTRSLEDPTFATRVESVDADLIYRVDFAGRSSETYRIKVFEYPALRRTDAHLVYPQYTSLDTKTVEDIRHVTLVEGTELTLIGHLNKQVTSARLIDPEGNGIELKPNAEAGPLVYQATFTPTETKRYKVQLTDHDGRSNKQVYEIAVHVTRNNAPIVKMIQPSRDVRVSPVEELALKTQMEDDFGITRQGLSFAIGGAEPREIELKGVEVDDKGKEKQPAKDSSKPLLKNRRLKAEHLLDFESMKAVPDQLITYFFWAEDIGPDGKPRRTAGDMFFAEVRHFEEIFRQGEQPSASAEMEMNGQQQGQNAQQSDKLAELQKEIINGTWKLIRRETGSKPTDAYGADAKVLLEGQQSAIEQADALAGRLRDEKSKASLQIAVKAMREAEKQLAEAAKGTAANPLRPALASEQTAYQALLKLRAREFEVVRGNRQRGQQGGGGASQQQLQQLELNEEQNRYEEQRAARSRPENQTKEQQEARESRQVLSRLRELAQRQGDLNNRLKELQSALEAAKDQQTRAEIERQLKRLREQQQEILRDTDELRERMENEQNRQRMAEARNQIEQGRENLRQAAEALEKGTIPQAITEGARAGQKLEEVKEQMRKETANRFSEQVTDLKNQARELDERQNKLTEQLDARTKKGQQRSLRDIDDRKQTRQELDQQKKQLDQVMNRMQETVTEAEETEPRLAGELFDTARKAREGMLPEALEETEKLVDLGVTEEAAKSSRRVGQGIGEMRQGIDRAARSVLGDDTAALRLAQQELKDLSEQLDREIARGTGRPNQPQAQGQNPQQQAQQPGQSQRPGQGQPGEGQQPGEREQGQGQQPGQGQRSGQGQLGQRQQPGQEPGPSQPGEGQQPGQGGQQQGQRQQRGGGSLRGGQAPRQPGEARESQNGGGAGGAFDRLVDGVDRGGLPGWGAADGPITGEGYRQWADRMRDVEELIEDAALRAEAARIRDRVRGTREDYKRHSKAPDWSKLQDLVANPIHELQKRLVEEVRRRESPDSLVPIDRDPVPPQFAEGVRRYYERLGSGQ